MTIEKVTLSLDRKTLETVARKANKTMSEYVRDLIQCEATMFQEETFISEEIQEMKGCLSSASEPTKTRLHRAARDRIRR